MESIFDPGLDVFIGLTLVLFGGVSILTGQGLARGWKSVWYILPYGFLLACADRFLTYALFDGVLLNLPGFVVQWVWIVAIGSFAHRLTFVRKMVNQYPWLYERDGLLGWRERAAG